MWLYQEEPDPYGDDPAFDEQFYPDSTSPTDPFDIDDLYDPYIHDSMDAEECGPYFDEELQYFYDFDFNVEEYEFKED